MTRAEGASLSRNPVLTSSPQLLLRGGVPQDTPLCVRAGHQNQAHWERAANLWGQPCRREKSRVGRGGWSLLLPCQLPGMGKNGHHGMIMLAYISKTHSLAMQEKAELRHREPASFG